MRDRKDVFGTATGRLLYVMEPDPALICIEDIANSAAKVCRYNGHVRPDVEFYGVGQHAVIVSHLCLPVNAQIALFHAAAEAYVHDIVRGVKHALGDGYRAIESAWTAAVDEAFCFSGRLLSLPADVKRADERALAAERRDLCTLTEVDEWVHKASSGVPTITPLLPFAARRLFLARYRELFPEARERMLTPATLGAILEVP